MLKSYFLETLKSVMGSSISHYSLKLMLEFALWSRSTLQYKFISALRYYINI